MRHLGYKKLAAAFGQDASGNRSDLSRPDGQIEHADEVYEVLREIGIHLAAFLGIAAVVNVLLVLFGVTLV